MLHIAGSLPAMRKSNTKVRKKMHICKSPRRKIARKCIFCAGVPAYARIRAGATAQKSHCASNIFLWGETLPKCPALPCSTFGGNPPAGKGRAEDTKKSSRVSQRSCFEQNFCFMHYSQFMRYRKPQNRRTHIRITMRSTKAIQTYRATR